MDGDLAVIGSGVLTAPSLYFKSGPWYTVLLGRVVIYTIIQASW